MKSTHLKFEGFGDKKDQVYNAMVSEKFFADHKLSLDDVKKMNFLDLVKAPYNMGIYFHNSEGPAVWTEGTSVAYKEYRLEGKRLNETEVEEFEKTLKFNNKVSKLIDND